MHRIPFILLIVLVAFCHLAHGQKPPTLEELKQKLTTVKDPEKPALYGQIGFLFMTRDNFDSALHYGNLSLEVAQRIGDESAIADSYNNLGTLYRIRSENEKAMELLLKALSLYEKNNLYKQSSKSLANIAHIYAEMFQYDKAIEADEKAIANSEKAKDTITLINLYASISDIYGLAGQYQKIRPMLDKGTVLLQAISQRSFANPMDSIKLIYARSYFNKEMGYCLLAEKKYNEAKLVFEAEQVASRSFNTAPSNKADLLIGLGECNYQVGQFEQTIRLTDSALALLKHDSIPVFYKRIYEMRANSFDQLGKYSESLSAYRLFKAISDSINNSKTNKVIAEMRTRYETEKKDLQIASLHKTRRSQQVIIALAIIGAIIALVLFFLVYRSGKMQKKIFAQKEELMRQEKEIQLNAQLKKMNELEQLLLRTQMNPHFIFNSLNSVQHFVLKQDVEGVNKYLAAFAHLVRQVLNNSAKPFISVDDEIKYLETYLLLEKMKSNGRFGYSISVDENIDLAATFIPGMILQPFVENSIRHGVGSKEKNDGWIHINIAKNDKLVCLVEDNGVGRAKSGQLKLNSGNPVYESKGMDITLKRIDTINKIYNSGISIIIDDLVDPLGEPSGTRVKVEFPADME
jgi:tetratricopeptide (TPR) repeat protein